MTERLAWIVDDNRQTADSMARMLRLLEVRTHVVYGPRKALIDVLEERPDVVFLDIHMPGIDGFEVLSFFRRDPRFAKVPVVIVSTETQPENVTRAKAEGAVAFLPKPVTVDSLEAVLIELFK